jgi:MFS family permease
VLVLVFFVKEIVVKKKERMPFFGNIVALTRGNRPLLLLLIITGIFSLGAFNFSFVLIRASELGVQESMIPLVYAAINISHTAIGIPSGIAADRIGKEKMLVIGFGIFLASSVLMISMSGNALYAYLLAAVFGLYAGVSETVQRAVIPRYVASELRGTAFGLYYLVVGVCFFVSNVLFGFLWDVYGLSAAVTYSSIVSVIAISAMLVFIRKIVPQYAK